MREIQTLEGLEEPTVSMAWSLYGDTILQASKNGVIRLYDPRAQAAPVYTGATDFVAAKGVNVTFINDSRDYFTTGFSKSVHRCGRRCPSARAGDPYGASPPRWGTGLATGRSAAGIRGARERPCTPPLPATLLAG